MNDLFRKFAIKTSELVGSPWAFMAAALMVIIWALSGPFFDYSDTWELVINTATTIVTFLMVFLIQNAQNRDAKALHLKLDELIRAVEGARNGLVDLEDLTDEELARLQQEFERLRNEQSDLQSEVVSAHNGTDAHAAAG
ncbi:MAG TPA: low affinity iron permease family protein [Roseiflexaceae bacterium]|nr:low affinity iron permease family protein [Roseiflexaceae bacterium]